MQDPRGPLVRRAFDAVVVVGMLVFGYVLRRRALPTTSLFFDDAWVVSGALHFRPSQIIIAGSAHPGFTVALRVWHEVLSGGVRRLALLPLLVGCAGPPLLYLGLRSLRFARSICLLLASALLVAKIHVLYSGRIKPYTLDVVLVMVILVVVPRFAAKQWRWSTAAAWVAGAVVLGTFSGNVLITTALAAVILVLHPVHDRMVRLVALAVQGSVQLLVYALVARSSDLAGIEKFMNFYDGHLTAYANPRRFGDEILTHIARIAEVYPGGSGAWLRLIALAAVAGLVIGAVRPHNRSEAIATRLALALFGFAFIGALFDRFPFGPSRTSLFYPGISPGSRHALWFAPIFALGLAVALSRVWEALNGSRRLAFDGVAIVATVAVLLLGHGRPHPYPGDESAPAVRYVDQSVASSDAVIITDTFVYSFAVSTTHEVVLAATPTHQVGFTPTFKDERIHGLGPWSKQGLDPKSIRGVVTGASTVVVYDSVVGPGSDTLVAPTMQAQGFRRVGVRKFPNQLVTTWKRG